MMMGPNDYININDGKRQRLAIFAELNQQLTRQWLLNYGLRLEQVSTNTGEVQAYSNMMMGITATASAVIYLLRDENQRLLAQLRSQQSTLQRQEQELRRSNPALRAAVLAAPAAATMPESPAGLPGRRYQGRAPSAKTPRKSASSATSAHAAQAFHPTPEADQRAEIGPSSSPDRAASGGPPPAGAPSSSQPTWSEIEEIRGDGRTSSNTLTINML